MGTIHVTFKRGTDMLLLSVARTYIYIIYIYIAVPQLTSPEFPIPGLVGLVETKHPTISVCEATNQRTTLRLLRGRHWNPWEFQDPKMEVR